MIINERYTVAQCLAAFHEETMVLLVTDALDKKRYAMKVAVTAADSRKNLENQLKKEFAVLRNLKHPNLARAYEMQRISELRADSEDGNAFVRLSAGQLFLTAEYINGGTIIQWAQKRCSGEEEQAILARAKLLLQTAEALSYFHSNDLIHSDIKPDNVLVATNGTVKLIDAGLVQHKGLTAKKVNKGGTLAYLAPEVLLDRTNSDPRSDQYSLGILGCELLFNITPPSSNEMVLAEDMASVRMASLPPCSGLKNRLKPILERLREKDPGARYPAMSEVVQELSALIPSECRAPSQHLLEHPPMVDRILEMEQLLQFAEGSKDAAKVLVVTGEAGSGKSRLLTACQTQLMTLNYVTLLLDPLDPSQRPATWPRKLAHWYHLSLSRTDAAGIRDAISDGKRGTLGFLFIDHYEQASDEWLQIFDLMVRQPRAFSIIISRRPKDPRQQALERRHEDAINNAEFLELKPLPQEEITTLTAKVLGGRQLGWMLMSRIHEAGRGLPGHVSRMLDQLMRQGFLVEEGASKKINGRFPSIAKLKALITSTPFEFWSDCSPLARKILEVMAFYPMKISFEDLLSILVTTNAEGEADRVNLAAAIQDLCLKTLIREDGGLNSASYSLAAPTMRDYIVQQPIILPREMLSKAILAVREKFDGIEKLLVNAENTPEDADTLFRYAEYYEFSGVCKRALVCFTKAGKDLHRARKTSYSLEAFERAYDCLKLCSDVTSDERLIVYLYLVGIASAHDAESSLHLIEEILPILQADHSSFYYEFLLTKAQILRDRSQFTEALIELDTILREADSGTRARATREKIHVAYFMGETEQALSMARELTDHLRSIRVIDKATATQVIEDSKSAATILIQVRQFVEAKNILDDASRIAHEYGISKPELQLSLAQAEYRNGNFQQASELIMRLLSEPLNAEHKANVRVTKANLEVEIGEWVQAQQDYIETFEFTSGNNASEDRYRASHGLGAVYRYTGNYMAARAALLAALAIVSNHYKRDYAIRTKLELFKLDVTEDVKGAPQQLERHLQLMDTMPNYADILAEGYALLAHAYYKKGEVEKSENALKRAIDLVESVPQLHLLNLDGLTALKSIAVFFMSQEKVEAAEEYMARLQRVLTATKRERLLALFLEESGSLPVVDSRVTPLKVEWLVLAKQLYKKLGDSEAVAATRNRIEVLIGQNAVERFIEERFRALLQPGSNPQHNRFVILQLAHSISGCERHCLILQRNALGAEFNWSVPADEHHQKTSNSVLKRITANSAEYFTPCAQRERDFENSKSVVSLNLMSIFALPLFRPDRRNSSLIGVLYFDDTRENYEFTEEIKSRLRCLRDCVIKYIDLIGSPLQSDLSDWSEMEKKSPLIYASGSPLSKLETDISIAAEYSALYPVLITGETGTGKELVAKELHRRRWRDDKKHPLIVVNCGEITPTLASSELFGHKKGSFTGAIRDNPGKFLAAQNGAIFLDEIGTLPLETQAALLRVIDQHQIIPVGEQKEVEVNAWVIAATNEQLLRRVEKGTFREDLYYRIANSRINVPPLRQRKDDIRILAHYFNWKAAAAAQVQMPALEATAVEKLSSYDWPGNVRQLQQCIQSAVRACHLVGIIRSENIKIDALSDYSSLATMPAGAAQQPERSQLEPARLRPWQAYAPPAKTTQEEPPQWERPPAESPPIAPPSAVPPQFDRLPLEEWEKARVIKPIRKSKDETIEIEVREALQRNFGSIKRSAKALGITPGHLHKLIRKFSIEPKQYRE